MSLTSDEQWLAAQQALDDGEYGHSIALWQRWIEGAPSEQQWEGKVALAQAYLGDGQWTSVIALLEALPADVAAPIQARGLSLLGQAYEKVAQWPQAIETYNRYLQVDNAAAPYVQWRIARAYRALGQTQKVAETLSAIDVAGLPAGTMAEILEELATALRSLEDYDGALAVYERILGFARIENYRALLSYRRGEVLRQAGRNAEARETMTQVLAQFATTPTAYLALQALDELNAAEGIATDIDDLGRGQILYHGRQNAASAEALERYIAQGGSAQAEAHYWLGLARARLGQYPGAFAAYDVVIEQHPEHSLAPAAWMSKAEAARANGGDPSGIYHEFGVRYPDHARVPGALWSAGQFLLRAGRWDEARAFYRRLHSGYPQDSGAREARFLDGLTSYALEEWGAARESWELLLTDEGDATKVVRLLLWIGLAEQRAGRTDEAHARWRDAQSRAPHSYYGLRARDLLAGIRIRLAPEVPPMANLTLSPDWDEIAAWIANWHSAATEGAGAGDLSGNARVSRALALWDLGFHAEAQTLLREVRDAVRRQPLSLLALTRLAHERGMHAVTISCAGFLIHDGRAAGAAAPPSLMRMLYPTAYVHLIEREAEAYALDPLLFLALLRQESRFDARAVSHAGATGLAQVMPATGEWIATRVAVGDYRHDLLTRPTVSVRFGVWFMGFLLDRYDRDWIAALAAYNGGPGSVDRWTGGAPIADHDLFYELIPFQETQSYVRLIYEQYDTYKRLYRP